MRALLFTTGSPFARGVRIILDELGLDYERREEITTPSAADRAKATPTLQVPTLWDGDVVLWESGLIAEYLMETYGAAARDGFATVAHRPEAAWEDRLALATVQTFGAAATTISQMKWSGVGVADAPHLTRAAEKLDHILGWAEDRVCEDGGFLPGCVSVQDVFFAAHVRFVEARPLDVDLGMPRYPKLAALLARLDERESFRANPVRWWEPGVTGYDETGAPIYGNA